MPTITHWTFNLSPICIFSKINLHRIWGKTKEQKILKRWNDSVVISRLAVCKPSSILEKLLLNRRGGLQCTFTREKYNPTKVHYMVLVVGVLSCSFNS